MNDTLLYLTEDEVARTLSVAEAIALAEKGIRADAAGGVVGDKFYMPVGEHGFIKPFAGYLDGEEYAYVKTFSFFPGNPQVGKPTTSSLVLLFEARTGLPVCLMEAGWVTTLKTAASSTVTAQALARPGADTAVIFGAGQQGEMHLRALAERFALRRVYVVDVDLARAEALARRWGSRLGFPVEAVPYDERERAVRDADLVLTLTTGDEPMVRYEWLKPGALVLKLGSYQELDLEVIRRADKVVVDRWKYVGPRVPELKMLAAEGAFGPEDVHAEWPDIVAGRAAGRERDDEIIVYIALGIWGAYAAILPEVYRRAVAQGLGTRLPRTV